MTDLKKHAYSSDQQLSVFVGPLFIEEKTVISLHEGSSVLAQH